MLESKLVHFFCAGTFIRCLFCCGKHIFRHLWGKVPRLIYICFYVSLNFKISYNFMIKPNMIILIGIFGSFFLKIECIVLLLKPRSKQCIRSSIHPLGLHSYFTSPHSLRIILFLGVELCWNIYPSTAYSSLFLLFLHIAILLGVWFSPTEYPYKNKRTWQIYQELQVNVRLLCKIVNLLR